MAKLTKEEWAAARVKWESDTREGFDWLVAELLLDVSRQAVSKTAKAYGWAKDGATKKVAEKKVAQPINKVAQPSNATKAGLKITGQKLPEKVAEKNPPHRPTLYKEEYAEQAYKFCLMGATDAELGEFFYVTEQTINNWKIDYPEFFESIKKGKDSADSNVVERLYSRAMGYSHTAEKIFNNQGEIIRAEYTEHYPPDTSACRYWLNNRQRRNWKDRVDVDTTVKIDKELLELIETQFIAKMQQAHERMQTVLHERGFIDVTPE